MTSHGHTGSLWQKTAGATAYPRLDQDLALDVVIVGGGISGLTAAYLLARAGQRVAVLEKSSTGCAESGLTTAHLTEVLDVRFVELMKSIGGAGTRLLAEASRASIDLIASIVAEHHIDCRFERVPGYLYTERKEDVSLLHDEAEAARRIGVHATLLEHAPLPFATKAALRFERQAQFHPREYLLGLARAAGCPIFEHTQVISVHDGEPCKIETEHGVLTARDVFVATNVPINNRLLVHTKIAAYRTYAIAAPIGAARVPPGLFWDTEDPYHYTRRQATADGEFLIVGGEDHRTGEERDTEQHFERLEQYLGSHFGLGAATHRWSGQIIEPVDGIPYIGLNPFSRHVYVGTGYSGNGMTFGTLAAMLVTDLVLGTDSLYAHLVAAGRVKPFASAARFAAENISFPRHLVKDNLAGADVEARSVEEVGRDEGKIVKLGGKRLAVYREPNGRLLAFSPVCPHLGCHVHWNSAESSWDCPCHGSRFSAHGELLNGPAKKGLEAVELEPPSDALRRS